MGSGNSTFMRSGFLGHVMAARRVPSVRRGGNMPAGPVADAQGDRARAQQAFLLPISHRTSQGAFTVDLHAHAP